MKWEGLLPVGCFADLCKGGGRGLHKLTSCDETDPRFDTLAPDFSHQPVEDDCDCECTRLIASHLAASGTILGWEPCERLAHWFC